MLFRPASHLQEIRIAVTSFGHYAVILLRLITFVVFAQDPQVVQATALRVH